MKLISKIAAAIAFLSSPAIADPTPLFMQMDRVQDPSPICANRLSTATGCQVMGYMSSGGVFSLPANIALPSTATIATPPTDNNSTRVINSQWYWGQAGSASPLSDGAAAAGTSGRWSRQDHVHPTDSTRAPSTYTGSGVGVTARLVNAKLGDFVNVADYGAVCDGTTDDRTSFEKTSTAIGATGGIMRLPFGKLCRLSGLTVPANVTLDGGQPLPDNPGGSNASITYGSLGGLALDSSGTITLGANSGIQNVFIKRNGMTFPAADATAFAGNAITFTLDGPRVVNVTALGFNTCIAEASGSAEISRYVITGFYCDALAGIYLDKPSYASSIIRDVQIHPFASANLRTCVINRSGYGIYFGSNQDDTLVDGVLIFGHAIGVAVVNSGGMSFGKIWIDYLRADGTTHVDCAGLPGTQGMSISGVSFPSISNFWAWSMEQGLVINTTATTPTKISNAHVENTSSSGVVIVAGNVEFGALSVKDAGGYAMNVGSAASKVTASLSSFGATLGIVGAPSGGITDNLKITLRSTDAAAGTAMFAANLIDPRVIASASTINLSPDENTAIISGTATINTLNGVFGGRRYTFIFQSTAALGTGGNIAAAFSGAANTSISLIYSSTQGKWIAL